MERFELDKLREIPIESVAETLGMKITKHKCLCPFHQDQHPSLSFHVGRNTYKCFVCDSRGGVIDFAMQVLNKNFKEACEWLADEHHIIMCHPERSEGSEKRPDSHFDAAKYAKFFERPYLNLAARAFLFQERKLHPAVIRWCHLNSYTDRKGIPWLQIPYYDINGQLIGIQSRRLTPSHPEQREGAREHPDGKVPKPSEGLPRFIFPKGSSCKIYNLPVLKRLKEGDDLWIAEGCSDCWALLSSGKKAIAIPSATLLRKKDLEVLTAHCPWLMTDPTKGGLHMFPDRDIPGEKLFLQLKAHLPQLIRHELPTTFKDYSEYYASNH